jgi:hypothetical protein
MTAEEYLAEHAKSAEEISVLIFLCALCVLCENYCLG